VGRRLVEKLYGEVVGRKHPNTVVGRGPKLLKKVTIMTFEHSLFGEHISSTKNKSKTSEYLFREHMSG